MIDRCYAKFMGVIWLVAVTACDRDKTSGPPAPALDQSASASSKRDLPRPQSGVASYYGPEFAGRETASGEPHDPKDMVAASRTLPLGTKARVTNKETGKSVAVEVNDRGPYAKGRVIDVSPKAAAKLGMKQDGTAPVKVQPLSVPKDDGG